MSRASPKVCKVGENSTLPPKSCNIFATFLLGSDGGNGDCASAEERLHGDITLVRTQDGSPVLDDGYLKSEDGRLVLDKRRWGVKKKVFHWFRFATEHFRWATHVAKMDLDTFPFPGMIARFLVVASEPWSKAKELEWKSIFNTSSGAAYPKGLRDLGLPNIWNDHNRPSPPPRWSETSPGLYFGRLMGLDWDATKGVNMQGQFYLLSMSTLRCMYKEAEASDWRLEEPREESHVLEDNYGEDSMMGGFLRWAEKDPQHHGHRSCPVAWRANVGNRGYPFWVDV